MTKKKTEVGFIDWNQQPYRQSPRQSKSLFEAIKWKSLSAFPGRWGLLYKDLYSTFLSQSIVLFLLCLSSGCLSTRGRLLFWNLFPLLFQGAMELQIQKRTLCCSSSSSLLAKISMHIRLWSCRCLRLRVPNELSFRCKSWSWALPNRCRTCLWNYFWLPPANSCGIDTITTTDGRWSILCIGR